MKVGFDCTPLARPFPRGVERAARGLVEALERRANLEVVRLMPEPSRSPREFRARDVPRLARELGLDGVHSFTSAFARTAKVKRVQTIHELPWLAGVRENADLAHRLWARLGPAFADAVVCPTEHVAAQARRYALLGRAKIGAIPWGVDAGVDSGLAPLPPPGVVDEVLLDRYRLGEIPFALCLGATRAKKNLAAALHGLAALPSHDARAREMRLVVTGDDTPELRRDLGLAAKLGLASRVLFVGAVPEDDLPGLIRLASAVCVLSRSEGFGFPALEALACGTPAIVPRGSAQAEVAGGGANERFVVDADEPESVAGALVRAVGQREELRFSLPARAAELTWDACALKVERLWESLA